MKRQLANHRSERQEAGYTLMELLVTVGLLTLLSGLLLMIFYQFLNVPRWGNAQMAVDNDLRNAALWLMRDGNESASFTPGSGCGTFATGHSATTVYDLSDSALQRTDSGSGQTIPVAHYVKSITCGTSGDVVVVTLEVERGSASASTTYTIAMRVR